MLIGVPKEIKVRESRVGLVPNSVAELTGRGHSVLVQTGAGARRVPSRCRGAGSRPGSEASFRSDRGAYDPAVVSYVTVHGLEEGANNKPAQFVVERAFVD